VKEKNVVKSSDINVVKKPVAKKAAVKKVIDGDNDGLVGDGTDSERPLKMAEIVNKHENVVIYFESGMSYSTESGHRFTRAKPIAEFSYEEANMLLRLENFRLASDEEREMYYNNKEG